MFVSVTSDRSRARRYVIQALYEWQVSGNAPKDIEQQFLIEHHSRQFDRAYFNELLRGVTEEVDVLDNHISPLSVRPFNEVDLVEKAILRLGCYELLHRLDIPYRVVINEAIELTKTFGADEAHRFINGTMDKLAENLRAVEVAAKKGS
ncbi:MAG: transcription antitermination factor NusB [Gammaproteobacteria bacterium]|nr:transcription antitermination factor NusB [Gammaproteobacteria bacterium]